MTQSEKVRHTIEANVEGDCCDVRSFTNASRECQGDCPTRGGLFSGVAIAGFIGLLLLLSPIKSRASDTNPPPQSKVTVLTTRPLPDLPGKEALILTVEYPPGGADPIHRHNAHVFVYVLEGSIVLGVKGGKPLTLSPGQTFYEGPDDIHTVGHNASKTKPAKFLVFIIKNQNAPAVIPVN
jgi:quercetin dioxygenase-like cupin family protein